MEIHLEACSMIINIKNMRNPKDLTQLILTQMIIKSNLKIKKAKNIRNIIIWFQAILIY